jgi:ABC-type lipoprotein release transport system permease subunit
VFILLIATFNGIGSLSMLIIDKEQDIRTLSCLGANSAMIRRVFLLEGCLVSVLGALGGLVVGLIVCLLQENLGLLKLGSGSEYIISAYPVMVQAMDVLGVLVMVLVLSFVASWIPTRGIKIND